jgi:hypothetical protein
MNDNRYQSKVGEVESVSGNSVSVKLADSIQSTLPVIDGIVYRVGQVGSFLKIQLGYANLFGIVTQMGATAVPEHIQEQEREGNIPIHNNRWIQLLLVGEQVGRKFERGITQFPTSGDSVQIVTIDDLEIIYGDVQNVDTLSIGNISVSESLDAKIDLGKLLTRHCAIVGSTGSGKSNAVAIILERIAQKNDLKSSRILLIDPHGEYNESLISHSKVFKINSTGSSAHELFVPFWALSFDELIASFEGRLSDSQREYIRDEVLKRKIATAGKMKLDISEQRISEDSPIPFSLKKLWFDLDDFERQTFHVRGDFCSKYPIKKAGDVNALVSNEYPIPSTTNTPPYSNTRAQSILKFLEGMRNKLLNQQYNFLYSPKELNPQEDGLIAGGKDLDSLLVEWFSHEKPITILDLSEVPSEITTSVSGTILKIIYDALVWGQNLSVGGKQQPLLVVLEEAHSYLKAGEDSISSRIVQKIAKEGRKYGCGLLLVTQRPSELDETVLSQCGSLIALRMSNSKDRGHVAAAVQDELQSIIDLLPSLRIGEALITGETVRIPSRVKFHKIAHAPKSADPNVVEQWKKERPSNEEYKVLVSKWRNQTLN